MGRQGSLSNGHAACRVTVSLGGGCGQPAGPSTGEAIPPVGHLSVHTEKRADGAVVFTVRWRDAGRGTPIESAPSTAKTTRATSIDACGA
jgi:hypothetical protein